MTVAAHPISQSRSLSPPAVRRSTTALTSPRPKIPLERLPDAKPAHALDQRGSCSSLPSTKLRVTVRRSDARDPPATHKSP
jgi:hypothetical protein